MVRFSVVYRIGSDIGKISCGTNLYPVNGPSNISMTYCYCFPIRKSPTEEELLIVGRLFVLFLVGVSVVWIPIINGVEGSLFDYIQAKICRLTIQVVPEVVLTSKQKLRFSI